MRALQRTALELSKIKSTSKNVYYGCAKAFDRLLEELKAENAALKAEVASLKRLLEGKG